MKPERLIGCSVLLGIGVVVLVVFHYGCWGNPDRDLVGRWGNFRLDGKRFGDCTYTFACDGTFMATSGEITTRGSYRTQREGEKRILFIRNKFVNDPDLQEIFSDGPSSVGELFRIEGKHLTVKVTRFIRGRPRPQLPPARDFAPDPEYSLLEMDRL